MPSAETLPPARANVHLKLAPCASVHVVPGLEMAFGGPTYSVPRLCQALGEAGLDTRLMSVAERGSAPSDTRMRGFRDSRYAWDHLGVPGLRSVRGSAALRHALSEAARGADVVHNHGLWLMPNVYAGWAARAAGRPLVVSPRGMLSREALAFSRVKKAAFWALLQRRVLHAASCVHATGVGEYEDVRALGLTTPVAIIPNGIDVAEVAVAGPARASQTRTVLSLGRIHPKKGLDRLVAAWARIEAAHPAWRLRIIGPAEHGHDEELRRLAHERGVRHLSIEPAVFGADKTMVYRSADLFVLPTLNENFGMTVAEALAAGVPVISTKGAPWSGLEAEGCGWWIDHGVDVLEQTLKTALALTPLARAEMGANGRAWMLRDFSWSRVAAELAQVYRWAAGAAPPPATLRFD